jgi:hypothetical protein
MRLRQFRLGTSVKPACPQRARVDSPVDRIVDAASVSEKWLAALRSRTVIHSRMTPASRPDEATIDDCCGAKVATRLSHGG